MVKHVSAGQRDAAHIGLGEHRTQAVRLFSPCTQSVGAQVSWRPVGSAIASGLVKLNISEGETW